MHNLVFTVLHYQAFQTTIDSIESIRRLETNGIEVYIVVVDNGSTNNSGNELRRLYRDIDNITILIEKENHGFARGNNIAYNYAKEHFSPDAIIVINNDVVFQDKLFIEKLKKILDTDKATSIIAPDIITSPNCHQNPARIQRIGFIQIAWILLYNTFIFCILHIPVLSDLIYGLINSCKTNNSTPNINWKIDTENITPHGSAIIFANDYIHNEINAFDPRTFLYGEEELLYEHAIKKGYLTKYYHCLHVYHIGDVATSNISDTLKDSRKFVAKHKIHSMLVLLSERVGK